MNKAFTLALCELSLWLLADMGISKFVRYHRYLSSVSLRLQMDYRNTWISWFTRQLDLELMFTSIISLRTANWNKWTKLFTELLTLSIGYTYSLVLFIRFRGFIRFGGSFLLVLFIVFIYPLALFIRSGHWIYLLALFTDFIYALALSIRFGGSIYLSYLWGLVSAYTVFILMANSVSSTHASERNTLKLLSISISDTTMVKIARLTLRHHPYLMKLTLLKLHHHTFLIKLTYIVSLLHSPYTCPLIKLTNIISFHHNCYACSLPTLHCSNIIPNCWWPITDSFRY